MSEVCQNPGGTLFAVSTIDYILSVLAREWTIRSRWQFQIWGWRRSQQLPWYWHSSETKHFWSHVPGLIYLKLRLAKLAVQASRRHPSFPLEPWIDETQRCQASITLLDTWLCHPHDCLRCNVGNDEFWIFSMHSIYCIIYIYIGACVCVIIPENSKLRILVGTGPIIQNMFERFRLHLFFIFAPCLDTCLRLPGRCRGSEPKRCHAAAACPQAVGNASHKLASCHQMASVLDAMFPEQGFGFRSPVVLGYASLGSLQVML